MGATLDLVQGLEAALNSAEADLSDWFHDDMIWDGNVGCGRWAGRAAYTEGWQRRFRAAFADRRFHTDIWMEDGDWAAAQGACVATHAGPFMGHAATGRAVTIPYIDFWQVRDGRIAYNKVNVDVAAVIAQMGTDVWNGYGWDRNDDPGPLPPSRQGPVGGRRPLEIVQAMERALQRAEVDVSDYFHDDFVWAANHGCGVKLGLQAFEDHWYLPFRDAFGDRDFRTVHYMQDGAWAACFGACHCTHAGEIFGLPATGAAITVPYIDFWRIVDGKIAENRVSVDFASVARQLGLDVFNGHGWDTTGNERTR